MKTKFILGLSWAVLLSTVGGVCIAGVVGCSAFGSSAALFGASLIGRTPAGVVKSDLIPEVWADFIVNTLFKNNDFITYSVDESQYTNAGVVHIPNAGAPSGVRRNRQKLPATVTRRKDVDVLYLLDEFTTDPRLITNAESVQLSYDKMDSTMSEDMSYLRQFVADCMVYNWRPQYFLKTTGKVVTSPVGKGERKALSIDDFRKAKERFNMWSVPKENRYALIETRMLGGVIAELKASENRDYSVIYDPISGTIKKIEGFEIVERESVLYLKKNDGFKVGTGKQSDVFTLSDDSALYTPEAIQAIEDEETNDEWTDDATPTALFWQREMVARAVGDTQAFDDKGSPYYYGDVISFLQRAGGRRRRADGRGVLGVVMDKKV